MPRKRRRRARDRAAGIGSSVKRPILFIYYAFTNGLRKLANPSSMDLSRERFRRDAMFPILLWKGAKSAFRPVTSRISGARERGRKAYDRRSYSRRKD